MSDVLNNPWFIGIAGGILSGLIVTLVSRAIFSSRDNREHVQKIAAANKALIYTIRPGIAEGIIPSKDVIEALIASTARNSGLNTDDLLGAEEVAQELIKEVMDSSFINADMKQKYCQGLTAAYTQSEPTSELSREIKLREARYRSRTIQAVSGALGVMTATMSFFLAFYTSGGSAFEVGIVDWRTASVIFLPVLSAVAATLAYFIVLRARRIVDARSERWITEEELRTWMLTGRRRTKEDVKAPPYEET
ncbi:hypothetical protein [Parvibaculum sp.]|jgi:hypothetical protein|uniref:hypothetical protein n=1 Tax=Parvibaculum sp. TaxID=2024848 RepID=UPI002FDACA10